MVHQLFWSWQCQHGVCSTSGLYSCLPLGSNMANWSTKLIQIVPLGYIERKHKILKVEFAEAQFTLINYGKVGSKADAPITC